MSATYDNSDSLLWLVQDINLFHASLEDVQTYWIRDILTHMRYYPDRRFFEVSHLIERVFAPLNRQKALKALDALKRSHLVIEGERNALRLNSSPDMMKFIGDLAGCQFAMVSLDDRSRANIVRMN